MSPRVGTLVPQNMPPIRITKTFQPVSKRVSVDGAFITFDMGENMAGFCTLSLTEKRGGGGGSCRALGALEGNAL